MRSCWYPFKDPVFWAVALPLALVVFVATRFYLQRWHGMPPVPVEKEHVGLDDLFLDAVRMDCPADPAYAHADECIRTRRGVGFFFVDDNGVPRVVSVVGVGRIQ